MSKSGDFETALALAIRDAAAAREWSIVAQLSTELRARTRLRDPEAKRGEPQAVAPLDERLYNVAGGRSEGGGSGASATTAVTTGGHPLCLGSAGARVEEPDGGRPAESLALSNGMTLLGTVASADSSSVDGARFVHETTDRVALLASNLLRSIAEGEPVEQASLSEFAQAVQHLPIAELARRMLADGGAEGLALAVRMAEQVASKAQPPATAHAVGSSSGTTHSNSGRSASLTKKRRA